MKYKKKLAYALRYVLCSLWFCSLTKRTRQAADLSRDRLVRSTWTHFARVCCCVEKRTSSTFNFIEKKKYKWSISYNEYYQYNVRINHCFQGKITTRCSFVRRYCSFRALQYNIEVFYVFHFHHAVGTDVEIKDTGWFLFNYFVNNIRLMSTKPCKRFRKWCVVEFCWYVKVNAQVSRSLSASKLTTLHLFQNNIILL